MVAALGAALWRDTIDDDEQRGSVKRTQIAAARETRDDVDVYKSVLLGVVLVLRLYSQFLALFSWTRGSGKTDGGRQPPSTGTSRPLERCCTSSFAFCCRARTKSDFY